MATLIKDIIPTLLEQRAEWQVKLLTHWQEIIGSLQTRVRLEKICDDMLVIGVYESHWMQELYLLSSVLIDSINGFLGEPRIQRLRFKLVEEKKKKAKEKPAFVYHKPAIINLTPIQEQALAALSDEQLRASLIQFWNRCLTQQELAR